MSATVIELGDGASYQGRADGRDLRRVLSVDSDTALTATAAAALSGVPIVGDVHPDDPGAFCSNVSAVSDDGGFGWLITCDYSTAKASTVVASVDDSYDPSNAQYVGSGFPSGASTSWAADDPCRTRWTFELGFDQVQVNQHTLMEVNPLDADIAQSNPGQLTSGEIVKGGVKETLYIPIIVMTKSVPDTWTDPNAAAGIQGAINTAECTIANFTIPKYGAIMKTFAIRRAYWGKYSTAYWEVRIEIACWYKALPTYKALLVVLQYGTYYLDGTSATNFKGDSGSIGGGLIDAAGAKTATPYYRRFVPSAKYDFRTLSLPKKV